MTIDETGPGLVIGIMTEDAEGIEIEIAKEIAIGIEVERRAEMMTIGISPEGTCFFFHFCFFFTLRFLVSKVLKCSFFVFVCSLIQICGGSPSNDKV